MAKMRQKEVFTKQIKQAEELATRDVTSLTGKNVEDGAGAIIVNDLGEVGYDLRPPQLKGVLAPHHPVRIASEVNPKELLNTTLETIAKKYGFEKAVLDLSDSKATHDLYASPYGFFPQDIDSNSEKIVQLESRLNLKLGGEELRQIRPENAAFISMYLEYALFVLFNDGHGQIGRIEKIARKALPTNWKVSGIWVQAPKSIEHHRLLDQALLVTQRQSNEGLFCLPNSGFDYQYKDMLARLIKAEGQDAHTT